MEDTAGLHARAAYSLDETAEILGLSRQLLNDLVRTGELHSTKAGRRVLISRHHIAQFLGVPESSIG